MKRVGLFLLVNFLVLVMIGVVSSILGIRYTMAANGLDYYSLFVFAAIIGFSGSVISLFLSKQMAKSMMRVQVLDPGSNLNKGQRQLVETVHDLAQKAGLRKMPEVGIYLSDEVNAFATGPTRNNSLVAVSSGLLQRLDYDAVEGVLAHEIAHIANGDMVTMTLVQGIINTFVMFLSRVIAYIAATMAREDAQRMVHHLSIIVFQILFSILGSIVVMAFSRRREFKADSGGAELAGRQKMVRALKSLQGTAQLVDNRQESLATFKISGQKKGGLKKLLSTHPSLEDRITRLEQMPIR